MREKKKKRKKLTWSLINAPLCSCMYIQGEERKKQQGKEKKKLIGVQQLLLYVYVFSKRGEKKQQGKGKKTH